MEQKEGRRYKYSQVVPADALREVGNILIQISEILKTEPERWDMSSLIKLLKNFRMELLNELKTDEFINYDNALKGMSKDTIIRFVKDCYNETIPNSWNKWRVTNRAIEIFDKHGGLDKFKDMMLQFQHAQREGEARIIDVYSMEVEEIKKVLGEIAQTGGVEAVRKALPLNLRYLLKGVTNNEYAIKKVVDQITRLRASISTFLQQP